MRLSVSLRDELTFLLRLGFGLKKVGGIAAGSDRGTRAAEGGRYCCWPNGPPNPNIALSWRSSFLAAKEARRQQGKEMNAKLKLIETVSHSEATGVVFP